MSKLMFRPLKAEEIDARVQSFGQNNTIVLLYKDARVDQNILDETVGALNWQKHYSRDNQNCTISIWDSEKSQWISKEDTGTESNTEKEKGLASDSQKRAGAAWGIGRELYTTPVIRIPNSCIDIREYKGKTNTFDTFYVDSINVEVDENTGIKRIIALSIGIEHNNDKQAVWTWKVGEKPIGILPKWIKCSQCKNDIIGSDKASSEQIASYNLKNFGRVLCANCGKVEKAKTKA